MTISRKDVPRTAFIIIIAAVLCFTVLRLVKPMFLGSGMFPELENAISDVRTITISSGDGTLRRSTILSNQDGKIWVVASAANAPADADKIRALIIALTRLENADMKSANPKDWPPMGLGPAETTLTVTDSNKATVADLRLGNAVDNKAGAQYFRIGDKGSAFVGFGMPPLSASALNWTTAQMPKLSPDRIKRVLLIAPDLSRVDIERRSGNNFAVTNLVAGEASHQDIVNALVGLLSHFIANDLISTDAINWFNATTFLVDSEDGLGLSGQIKFQSGQYWVRMNGGGTSTDAKSINSQRNLAFAIPETQAKLLLSSRSILTR